MKIYNYKGSKVIVKIMNLTTPNRIELYEAGTMEPFLSATSNIPALKDLEGYVAVKNYTENEGMLDFLIDNEIVDPPVTFVKENYVTFPICKLK